MCELKDLNENKITRKEDRRWTFLANEDEDASNAVRTQNQFRTSPRKLEVPGIEPGASCMLSTRSTTELHPLPESLSVRVLQEIAHYILWASSQLVFVVLVVVCVAAGFTTSLRQRKSGNCEGY